MARSSAASPSSVGAAAASVPPRTTTRPRARGSSWAPRLLIIDHHDSYTANLLTLLPAPVVANTVILQHTHELVADPRRFDVAVAPHIDAIIISPGPGSPENEDDFGTAARILQRCLQQPGTSSSSSGPLGLPVLGICLGHQGIATACGGKLKRAQTLRHGSRSALTWSPSADASDERMGTGLFADIPQGAQVVRYNSLTVNPIDLPSSLRVTAWAKDAAPSAPIPSISADFARLYTGSRPPPNAETPATTTSPRQDGELVVMAIEHKALPLWGVQFHPESVESEHGHKMLANFLDSVHAFWTGDGPRLPDPHAAQSRLHAWNAGHGLPPNLLHATFTASSSTDLKAGPPEPRSLHQDVESHEDMRNVPQHESSQPQIRPVSPLSDESGVSDIPTPPALPGSSPLLFQPNSSSTSVTTLSDSSIDSKPRSDEMLALGKAPGQERSGQGRVTSPTARWRVIAQDCVLGSRNAPTASDAPQVFERLFRCRDIQSLGGVWLDSARDRDPHSRYSYMAMPRFLLSYSAATRTVRLQTAGAREAGPNTTSLSIPDKTTFWDWMGALQADIQMRTTFAPMMSHDEAFACPAHHDAEDETDEEQDRHSSVFKGGFVGYFGYDMKNESLGLDRVIKAEHRSADGAGPAEIPDAEFLFCDRVLCFDHLCGRWTTFAVIASDSFSEDSVYDTSRPGSALLALQEALLIADGKTACQDIRQDSLSLLCEPEAAARSWFDAVSATLADIGSQSSASGTHLAAKATSGSGALPVLLCDDTASTYRDKVELARQFIAAGESYELCITTAFRGRRLAVAEDASDEEADWDHFGLYCALRQANAAPYSAYLQLPSLDLDASPDRRRRRRGRAILSTSPERFIRILRSGEAEMKPIKGTLARAGFAMGEEGMLPCALGADASGAEVEREASKTAWRREQDALRRARLAADPKERAENLMIVDLIRADLLTFCHASSVRVPKLMRVETYATIHQLVTTVRGQLRAGVNAVEALRTCFPPGSMTGAPKRRSVQILEDIEAHGRVHGAAAAAAATAAGMRTDTPAPSPPRRRRPERGIYSGVLGWLGLDGAADFAVVIRTAVAEGDDISVGAGGAVTYLSTTEGELAEMLGKASSVVRVHIEP